MRSRKIGSSKLLDIGVYPMIAPFDVEHFTQYMIQRVSRVFASQGGEMSERVFVAVTRVDPETKEPPMTLTVIVPKWHMATRDAVCADVREFLARSQGLAVCSAAETNGVVVVTIEAKKRENSRHRRAYSAKIVKVGAGRVLSSWEPTSVDAASVPLLPAEPMDLV